MLRSTNALAELATGQPHIYHAGIPGYRRNFSRDSLTYGLLADDLEALEAQLAFSAKLQGTKPNPMTGEEPGKIHHEYPGKTLRDRLTTYNGCDTSALFLLAAARLAKRGRGPSAATYKPAIEKAVAYITSHIYEGIFYEDTKQSGADPFALKVTYWKDSELNATKKEPTYPIAYMLAHFQNKAALQEIGEVMGKKDWRDLAKAMARKGLETFWAGDHFIVAQEQGGARIDAPSSDSLHALLFLEPHEISSEQTKAIERYSEQLVTDLGYLSAIPQVPGRDTYHTAYIWVHEQALLHAAAFRHGLTRAQQIAQRIIPIWNTCFPELVDPHNAFCTAGNPIQLWSIGAYIYFERLKPKLGQSHQSGHRHTPAPEGHKQT